MKPTKQSTDSLTFIKDVDLFQLVQKVVDALTTATKMVGKNPYKNVLDPFSAIFEAIFFRIDMRDWMKKEQIRQVQKSFQNSVGEFHQAVLGKIHGWEDLKIGQVADVANHELRIVAEIKNKYNTTKGSDRVRIYDGLAALLGKPEYRGYTAYYVEIIPRQSKRVNIPFAPSDNTTKTRRVANDVIRQVDGATFYSIATGRKHALKELYEALPLIIAQCCGSAMQYADFYPEFHLLFQKAFGVDKNE